MITYSNQPQQPAFDPDTLTADEAFLEIEKLYGKDLGQLACDLTLELVRVLVTCAQSGIGLGDLGSDTELAEPKNVQLYSIIARVLDYSDQLTLMRYVAEFI